MPARETTLHPESLSPFRIAVIILSRKLGHYPEPRLEVATKLRAEKTFRSLPDFEKEVGSFSIVYETSGIAEAFSSDHRTVRPGWPNRLDRAP
jgi:hypothetical protein